MWFKQQEDKAHFKRLILATGEEYENGTIETLETELTCIPSNCILLTEGKLKLIVNKDFIVSLELKQTNIQEVLK